MIRAYHFVGATLRDGSPIPPDGEWLEFSGECVMCTSGLHWSRHPFHALTYAPGATLCLDDVDEIIAEQNDKGLSRRRRIVARFDATDMLWEMARWSALQVIHLWNAPQVVRDYLTTGDESLRAAAWAAARDAAQDAAWDAAEAAAGAAQQNHFLALVTAQFAAMGVDV